MQPANDTTINASRTITPIDGTNGRFEWYQYNDDLNKLVHDKDNDGFQLMSICRSMNFTKKQRDNASRWVDSEHGASIIKSISTALNIEGSQLVYQIPKKGNAKGVDGLYIHRYIVNMFVADQSPSYLGKIVILLDDHFELQRKVEENRVLSDENKTLIQKVDQLLVDNRELKQSMKSVQSTMTKMEITLNSLVESVSEIRNHVTSNKICRYVIILWVIDGETPSDYATIRPFCGPRENIPKVDGRKVFECEVPCSIDTFKETLERLKNDYHYKTYYRSIVLRAAYVDEFIEAFSYTFKRINRTVYDISAHLDDIKDTITSTGTELSKRIDETQQKLESIEDRIAKFDQFISSYGADRSLVKRLLDGELKCSRQGKVYTIQLSTECQRPFIIKNDRHSYITKRAFRQMYL